MDRSSKVTTPSVLIGILCVVILCALPSRSRADCWLFSEFVFPMGGGGQFASGVCTCDGTGCPSSNPQANACDFAVSPCICGPGQQIYEICQCSVMDNDYSCNVTDLENDPEAVVDATLICPNGILDPGEQCDDGNYDNGDGCSSGCLIETGWFCAGQPSVCTPSCGDGLLRGGEQCDDGNIAGGDGCSADCTIEPGWSCAGQPSVCTPGCGDGKVHGSEQCDEGVANGTSGSCCNSDCAFKTIGEDCDDLNACTTNDSCNGAGTCVGGPPRNCDDGNLCTQDSCDSGTGCIHDTTPVTGCKAAGKSLLLLKNSADDTKDKLTWKWLKGAATTLTDLGIPATTNYALCVYAGTAVATIDLPAGSKWQAAGTKSFKFNDPTGTPDGAQKASIKSGGAGEAKALVKGKGTNLPENLVGVLPLPVTAQLVSETTNLCFGSVYNNADVIKNDGTNFKAKH